MPSLNFISRGRREGRTTVAAGLAALLNSRGKSVAYHKPVSIDDGNPDADVTFVDGALNVQTPSTPISGTEAELASGLGPHKDSISKVYGEVTRSAEVSLVEGLPFGDPLAESSAELADIIDAPVVAVVRYRRGLDISELSALRQHFGERLRGVVLNGVPFASQRLAREEAAPALAKEGVEVLGVIPEDRCLLSVSVQDFVEALEGKVLSGEEQTGALVEHVLIGAMIVDASGPYYDRYDNKVLVTRTDRPDLQWNAINEHTKGLILTGGGEPIRYVQDKAESFEVPLVVVPKRTSDVIDDIALLVSSPQFYYPQKMQRAAELVERHVDLAKLGL